MDDFNYSYDNTIVKCISPLKKNITWGVTKYIVTFITDFSGHLNVVSDDNYDIYFGWGGWGVIRSSRYSTNSIKNFTGYFLLSTSQSSWLKPLRYLSSI